jgi:hypothetical protein
MTVLNLSPEGLNASLIFILPSLKAIVFVSSFSRSVVGGIIAGLSFWAQFSNSESTTRN